MSDQPNTNFPTEPDVPQAPTTPPQNAAPADVPASPDSAAPVVNDAAQDSGDAGYGERLERLGGEPAPVITPEEFARLQKAGQVHIDAKGRVKTVQRGGADPGVSLRKRRAWYAA